MAEKPSCTTNSNKMSFVQNIVQENSPRRTCLESLDEDLGRAQFKRIKYNDIFFQENIYATSDTEKSLLSNDMTSKLIKRPLKMNTTIDLSIPIKENSWKRVRVLRHDSPNPNTLHSLKMLGPLQKTPTPSNTNSESKSSPYNNYTRTPQRLKSLPAFELKHYSDEDSIQTQISTVNKTRLQRVMNKLLSPLSRNIKDYKSPTTQTSRSQKSQSPHDVRIKGPKTIDAGTNLPGGFLERCGYTRLPQNIMPLPAFDLKYYKSETVQQLTPSKRRLSGIASKLLPPISKNIQDYVSPKSQLSRSLSESAVTIMKAVETIDRDRMNIGDCSKSFSLPSINEGKNPDLKKISAQTMASILLGEYSNEISGYEIIDCRYPYEFNGGHIEHAINLHTQKQVFERYLASKEPMTLGDDTANKYVLIFYCEFSSKRGPDMYRFLRGADRKLKSVSYPLIHYPEIYLLCGGYKSFFESCQELCVPQTYVPKLAPEHDEEYRFHRNKSKSELFQTKSPASCPFKMCDLRERKSFGKKNQL